MNESNKAEVYVDIVSADEENDCRDAMDDCPAKAISIEG